MSIKRTSRKYEAFGKLLLNLSNTINNLSIRYINFYIANTQATLKIEKERLKNQQEFLKIAQNANKIIQGDLDIEERKLKIEERKLKIEEKKRDLGITNSPFTAVGYDEPGNIRNEERNH